MAEDPPPIAFFVRLARMDIAYLNLGKKSFSISEPGCQQESILTRSGISGQNSQLEIRVEPAEDRSMICHVCGELSHREKAIPLLQAVDRSGEWSICPDCLPMAAASAERIGNERAESLDWLSNQNMRGRLANPAAAGG